MVMIRLMKNRVVRLWLLMIVFLGLMMSGLLEIRPVAYAGSDFVVNWKVTKKEPLFRVLNMMPGEVEQRVVKVSNYKKKAVTVSVKSKKRWETGNLGEKLRLTISRGNEVVYGPKSLWQFFGDSAKPAGLFLLSLGSGKEAEFVFKVELEPTTGNEYQGKGVIFDLKMGSVYKLPKKRSYFEKVFDKKKGHYYEDESGEYELDFEDDEEQEDWGRRSLVDRVVRFWKR